MLQAHKAKALTQFNWEVLGVRRKELVYWLEVYAKLGNVGAVLAALGWGALLLALRPPTTLANQASSVVAAPLVAKGAPMRFKRSITATMQGLAYVSQSSDVESIFHLSFIIASCAAFGCNLLLCSLCTFCGVFGPSYALQGCGGSSMHKAVRLLETHYPKAIHVFKLGVFFYLLTAASAILHFFRPFAALIVLGVVGICVRMLAMQISILRKMFHSPVVYDGRMHTAVVPDIGAVATRDPELPIVWDARFESLSFYSAGFANGL